MHICLFPNGNEGGIIETGRNLPPVKVAGYIIYISHMKVLHMIAFVLVIAGGLNWGLAAFNYNLVKMIVGSWPVVEQVVYVLIGLSAVYLGVTHKGDCKACSLEGTM